MICKVHVSNCAHYLRCAHLAHQGVSVIAPTCIEESQRSSTPSPSRCDHKQHIYLVINIRRDWLGSVQARKLLKLLWLLACAGGLIVYGALQLRDVSTRLGFGAAVGVGLMGLGLFAILGAIAVKQTLGISQRGDRR